MLFRSAEEPVRMLARPAAGEAVLAVVGQQFLEAHGGQILPLKDIGLQEKASAFQPGGGWAGKAAETIQALASGLSAEWLPSVFARGLPTDETLRALDGLADTIAERHKGLG